jgi:UDP-glucuronate 4-epimerase
VLDRCPAPNPAFDSAAPDPGSSHAPYRVYNIGNEQPVPLLTFIETLENALGCKATKNFLPMQAGDVPATYADIDDLRQDVGFAPKTSLAEGLARWAAWFRAYTERGA